MAVQVHGNIADNLFMVAAAIFIAAPLRWRRRNELFLLSTTLVHWQTNLFWAFPSACRPRREYERRWSSAETKDCGFQGLGRKGRHERKTRVGTRSTLKNRKRNGYNFLYKKGFSKKLESQEGLLGAMNLLYKKVYFKWRIFLGTTSNHIVESLTATTANTLTSMTSTIRTASLRSDQKISHFSKKAIFKLRLFYDG